MLKLKNHRENLDLKNYKNWLSENKDYLPHYFEKMNQCMDDYSIDIQKKLNYDEFCMMMYNASKR